MLWPLNAACLPVCVAVLPVDLGAVIAAAAELAAQVQAHRATAARLSSLSVQCGGAAIVLDELEALAGEETSIGTHMPRVQVHYFDCRAYPAFSACRRRQALSEGGRAACGKLHLAGSSPNPSVCTRLRTCVQ